MSRKLFARFAMAAAVCALASPSFAADTGTLSLTATVSGICKLTSNPTLTFSNMTLPSVGIDPTSATAPTGSANITYRCTKGTAPTAFTIGGSASPKTGSITGALASPDSLNYSLSWTNPTTVGTGFGASGSDITVAVSGSITSDHQIVKADTYTTTALVVSISP